MFTCTALEPLRDWLLIKPMKLPAKKEGILMLGDASMVSHGSIVKKGPTAQEDLSVGDVVMYPTHSSVQQVSVSGEVLVLVKDHNILSKVNI